MLWKEKPFPTHILRSKRKITHFVLIRIKGTEKKHMTHLSLKTKKGSWKVATSWESVLCSPRRMTKTWLWPCPTHIIKMLFTRVLCLLSASALRVQEFIPLCFREARKCKWLFKGALYVFALWTLFLSIWGVTLQINLQLLMPDFLVPVSVCVRLAGMRVAAMRQCLLWQGAVPMKSQ